VWAALTEPAHLERWFCDAADVDLRPGGVLTLPGETVFGGGGGQRLESVEPGRLLRWTWPLHGQVTRVTWLVGPVAGRTRVVAYHEFPDDYTSEAGEEAYTLWAFHLHLLKAYLETGEAPYRQRWARGAARVDVRHSVSLAAPAERVWAALTEPGRMDAWLSERAEVELSIDGRFSYGWDAEAGEGPNGDGPRRVVELNPGRAVAYSWNALGTPTLVRWTVEPEANRSRVTLAHTGFRQGDRAKPSYDSGWADYLNLLAIYIATGEPAKSFGGELPPAEALRLVEAAG
jgi:uncharacterized protein YndB with AHSA1/START domain